MTDSQVKFFPISVIKLLVMSLATLGLYLVYWHYKNWQFVKQQEQSDIYLVWRALFNFLFCYGLFKRITIAAAEHNIETQFNPMWMTGLYVVLTMSVYLPDNYFLLGFLSVVPMMWAQRIINQINEPYYTVKTRFSLWNKLAIICVCAMWLLVVLVMLSDAGLLPS